MAGSSGFEKKVLSDTDKLSILIPRWIAHNEDHIRDKERWLRRLMDLGLDESGRLLKEAIDLLKGANRRMELALESLRRSDPVSLKKPIQREKAGNGLDEGVQTATTLREFNLRRIGVIRTPYTDSAPYQPVEEDEGDFILDIDPPYCDCLHRLEEFRYIYVIYYVDRLNQGFSAIVSPPWADGATVGVFASRSPARPNPIGISIVRVKGI